jgi:hypothetical protein
MPPGPPLGGRFKGRSNILGWASKTSWSFPQQDGQLRTGGGSEEREEGWGVSRSDCEIRKQKIYLGKAKGGFPLSLSEVLSWGIWRSEEEKKIKMGSIRVA